MPRVLPFGQGNRVGQQYAPAVGVIPYASWDSRQESDGRGLEGILKQHRQIKPLPPPLAHLAPRVSQAGTLVDDHVIDEFGVKENVGTVASRNPGNVRVRYHAP